MKVVAKSCIDLIEAGAGEGASADVSTSESVREGETQERLAG